MTLREYLNAWKVLRSIDRHDLSGIHVGLGVHMDAPSQWSLFCQDPSGYLAMLPDAEQQAIWTIVEARTQRHDVPDRVIAAALNELAMEFLESVKKP